MVIWECETKRPADLMPRLRDFLDNATGRLGMRHLEPMPRQPSGRSHSEEAGLGVPKDTHERGQSDAAG